jgi:hypothetical protein
VKITQAIGIALTKAEEEVGVSKKPVDMNYKLPAEYLVDGDLDEQYVKHLHDKYYVSSKGRSGIETKFEKILDTHPRVKWWLKNYVRQYGKSFSVRYDTVDEKEGVFFPDYIVGLDDGRVLIVDTKCGSIDANERNKKAALIAHLANNAGVIGGLIRENNGVIFIEHEKEEPFDSLISGQSEMEFFKASVMRQFQ